MEPRQFPILFDTWYGVVSTALFLPPASSFVDVTDEEIRVQMGWAFQSHFPKTAVTLAAENLYSTLAASFETVI